MRLSVRTVCILLLTFGLFGYFLRNADMSNVWAETRRAERLPLALAVAVTGLTYVLRALRWQYLLAAIGPARFSTVFRTTVIGFAASFLLPARAGEVIRPYLLARHEKLSATAAFATVILERLLDLLTVLTLFAWFVLTAADGVVRGDPALMTRVKAGGVVAAVAAVAGAIVLYVLAGHPDRIGALAGRIGRVLPARFAGAVAGLAQTFAEGLAAMRQPRRLLVSLALSVPLWLALACGIWLTSRAFSITFPFSATFLVMTLLVVGVAVPTPGAIGGFHTAYELGVQTFFGAPTDRAVGAAIVLHAISFVPVTLLGVVFMAREGLTLAGARSLAERASTDATASSPAGAPPAQPGAGFDRPADVAGRR